MSSLKRKIDSSGRIFPASTYRSNRRQLSTCASKISASRRGESMLPSVSRRVADFNVSLIEVFMTRNFATGAKFPATKKPRSERNEVLYSVDVQKFFAGHLACRDVHCDGDALGFRTVQFDAVNFQIHRPCKATRSVNKAVIFDKPENLAATFVDSRRKFETAR